MSTNVTDPGIGADLPPLVLPTSPDYDAARRAWNLRADLRPAAVCRATCVEHVQAALAYARSHGLRVGAQTSGHASATLPDLSDALLLRVALHDGEITVNDAARTAWIKAGARWGEVVDAVARHGMTAMHANAPSVGVTGYLLGGGLSFYGRAHGLAANHVRAFDVVTVEGTRRRVDHAHEADLFYALRGGGGGFAVITAVEIELLPYREVTGGSMFFPAADAPALLRVWRDWSAGAPESIGTAFWILQLPRRPEVPEPLRGVRTVSVDAVALRPDDVPALERRLRRAARPIFGGFGPIATRDLVRLHGEQDPMPLIGDGFLLEELDDAAVEAFLQVTGPDSPLLAATLVRLGGALASPPPDAGARGHLEGNYTTNAVGSPGSSGAAADLDAHLDRYLEALRPWATGTRFANTAERWGSLETCVPQTALDRLRRIQRAVDPDHLLISPHPVTSPTAPGETVVT